ncbi:BREX-1 system adenine-specific DNA-methyltransferase PglX [Caldifermentibacillus hisashii]|uniref:BREX-1 system adenine-specific DNA-methyltransferase PglX n=1 Tax=Caldifermentibacillus hisashii TaxID=996558 RepID=UPI0022B9A072|nr:BREX-1 system adenine-specific DNA-methyltransferase PglX [Caldifermentibacillus hisashii]
MVMHKTELKNFAISARRELIEKVALRAKLFGIDEKQGLKIEEQFGQLIVNGETYPLNWRFAFQSLAKQLEIKGYDQLIEEVAYTWFNRIIAIRYMEVHGYLPERVNVLSSSTGKVEPDILTEFESMDLDVDKDQIKRLIREGDTEQAYRKLFIAQCNALHNILPFLFEKINDYTELLLPDYLLDSESIISQLVKNDALTESFQEVEVIGWLYQYYNTEPKEKVFANLKKNKKIEKYDIPAATQLFTPKWIVQYMVENSLGQLWLEANPNSPLREKMRYYIEPAEQEEDVKQKLEEIRYKNVNLEEITIIDPCCGSGHILVYAFELLYQMYEEAGYPSGDIPQLILEKNLYGLDIDDRAAQLASFSLMMKAREKSRRIFRKKIQLNILSIEESNHLDKEEIAQLIGENDNERIELRSIIETFIDAKIYGSMLQPQQYCYQKYLNRIQKINDEQLSLEMLNVFEHLETLKKLFELGKILASEYNVVITNPPYMGARGMNNLLRKFLEKNFNNAKNDTFSVFIERCIQFSKTNGFVSMITMESWMFLSKYDNLRKEILEQTFIDKAIHMPYEGKGKTSLGINFGTVSFILRKLYINEYEGTYQSIRYFEIDEDGVPLKFPNINERFNVVSQEKFNIIQGSPITYWMSSNTRKVFKENDTLDKYIEITGSQHITANNEKYLRYHWEVNKNDIGKRWVSYAKGGDFRRWFGNNELVVDWSDEAKNFYKNNKTSNLLAEQYRFRKGITWTATTNGKFSSRLLEDKGLFDKKGPALFPLLEDDQNYLLGYLNSKPVAEFLDMFSGTSDYQNIDIKRLPYLNVSANLKNKVNKIVEENLNISMNDWNSNETSIDFQKHPFMDYKYECYLSNIFKEYKINKEKQFSKLKTNEEELNDIFIQLFGLQDEVSAEVPNEEVTVDKPERLRDTKSFLSYFIGCVMGRYSLDVEGLAFAGGDWDESKYKTFKPNKYGLILLTDEYYFEDDIIARLREFLSVTFGEETVEENLQWLAESLEMKRNETAEERLRRYFLDEFFKDHCQVYQKRPIYWLVDSGKQKGLRTLIYMHRYQPDTMATIRFEHLQEIQTKYNNEIDAVNLRITNPNLSATEKRELEKRRERFQKRLEELLEFDKKLAEYANAQIVIDLDDGVKVNYAKFEKVLAKIK